MFNFFRKYQHYFFIVISIVIITSFTFFGTYSALSSNSWREQVAFTAIDGRDITRSDVDELSLFLATDSEDKVAFGGAWGPNFLNDGVIRKDFLETGIAQVLAQAYMPDLEADILRRLDREKRYTLYSHPQAKFIGTGRAWEYFAPEMTTHYQALQAASTPAEAFMAKTKLYLSEKSFPPGLLRQVLRYQEKQNSWLAPDPDLDHIDLSLFGYHTAEEWFGPHFTRLVSQFIINAAILAEQKGYQVSKAEALADLQRNAELSYQQNQNQSSLRVRNAAEYMSEQLHRLNMDSALAVKLWRDVMLFRRYFHDVGGTPLADTLVFQSFNQFTKEGLELDVYHLPSDLRFGDHETLQKFEIYLAAVSKVKEGSLELPKTFVSAVDIQKNYPELVQKRYLIEVSEADKKLLQSKVGIKEMWNWEVQDQNWETLKKRFPDLGVKKDKTREERFAALEGLDAITRSKVDTFAKESIVNSHPEWLQKAMDEAPLQKKVVGLRTQGGKMPFVGLDKKVRRLELIDKLDKAALKTPPTAGSALYAYSPDNQHYYRITVLERSPEVDVLTFAEAKNDGTLDELKDRILAKHYEEIRDNEPLLYQNSDKSWKAYKEVKDLVADKYFEKTLQALQKEYLQIEKNADSKTIGKDRAAAVRFYAYLNQARAAMQKDPKQAESFMRPKRADSSSSALSARESLADQWKLEREKNHIDRSNPKEGIDTNEAYALPLEAWSALKAPANGNLLFFQLKSREMGKAAQTAMADQTLRTHALLSGDAQRVLTTQLIHLIKEKGAISLAYLKETSEIAPPATPQME